MPDTIRKDKYPTPTHWLIDKYRVGEGKTACGRVMTGITGGGTATEIDCKRCILALRKDGWQV